MTSSIRTALTLAVVLMLATPGPAPAQSSAGEIRFKPSKVRISIGGSQCRTAKVQAINDTGAAIVGPRFTLSESEVFSIDKSFQKCPDPLGPGETCRVYVRFCPAEFRGYQADLSFTGTDKTIPVSGSATQRRQ